MPRFPGCPIAFSLGVPLALALPASAQGFFLESAPYDELSSLTNAPVLPWVDGLGMASHDYAPPDVPESHPAHRLTVFKPEGAAAHPTKRYPTVVFCTAGHFAEYPPQPSPAMGFLATARDNGFVVVTVGTVGANSFPTCSQLRKCSTSGGVGTDPGCTFNPQAPCWDPNIFYDPDQPGSPWNDFNYFYGEKDLTWAVQYVRRRAADFQVDDARIIVSGTSTGAIYAGFVALGPDRSWQIEYPFIPSPQARLSTQVAGLVCFEPVVWSHAIPPSIPPPGTGFQSGLHWPTSDDPTADGGVPYRTRCPVILDVPDGSFATGSLSRLIRQFDRQLPVFLASGDGFAGSTGFGRNGNLTTFDQDKDYDRWGSPATIPFLPGDPTIDFPHGASVPETRLHDTWNIVVAAKDLGLDQTDPPSFHARYSRAYVGDDLDWLSWPASMTANGEIPDENDPDLEQIPLLDGTYPGAGPSEGNPVLAPVVVDWMKRTFCVEGYPAVYCRNKGMNYPVLTGRTLAVGGSTTITVNMREVPEFYDAAWLYGFGAPAEVPVVDGEYVLCADDGRGELLGLGMAWKDANGVAEFTIDVPSDPALEGAVFFTQVRLYDLDGNKPDALTNAQDMVIQGP